MATNHISSSSEQETSKNILSKGPKIVQKVVTVGGRQVVLTGCTSNTTFSDSLKRNAKLVVTDHSPNHSPKKINCEVSSSCNIPEKECVKQVVSILPSALNSPSKIFTIPAGKVNVKTEGTSPVKLINLNAANSSNQAMPGSGTVLNFADNSGSKTITLSASSISSSDRKLPAYTLSPQKVYIKGQSVNVKGSTSLGNHGSTSSNIQPISVSGSKFQYVRLVPTSQGQSSGTKAANIVPTTIQKTIAPVVTQSTSSTSKIHVMPNQQGNKSSHQSSQQRLILPATTQVPIRPNLSNKQSQYSALGSIPGGAQALTQLPPGTTIISSGQNLQGVQGFALVPAQYVQQLQQTFTPNQSSCQPSERQNSSVSSKELFESRPSSANSQKNSLSGESSLGPGARARKPCNCTKSQCLKLYCECFANGEFCSGCNCANCYNNLDHEEDRARAIKQCLERNPHAFRPKIGTGKERNLSGNRRHNKGCNCKRSGCLKNYCECYEAKILCTHLCKCVGCKNFEESPEKKTLMHLADAAEVRVQQQTAAKCKLSSQIEDVPARPPVATSGEKLPFSFVTTEVAEATCSCLIAQGEEAERTKQIDIVQEKLILEEFGRCLMQVIESSNRTKDSTSIM